MGLGGIGGAQAAAIDPAMAMAPFGDAFQTPPMPARNPATSMPAPVKNELFHDAPGAKKPPGSMLASLRAENARFDETLPGKNFDPYAAARAKGQPTETIQASLVEPGTPSPGARGAPVPERNPNFAPLPGERELQEQLRSSMIKNADHGVPPMPERNPAMPPMPQGALPGLRQSSNVSDVAKSRFGGGMTDIQATTAEPADDAPLQAATGMASPARKPSTMDSLFGGMRGGIDTLRDKLRKAPGDAMFGAGMGFLEAGHDGSNPYGNVMRNIGGVQPWEIRGQKAEADAEALKRERELQELLAIMGMQHMGGASGPAMAGGSPRVPPASLVR